jgi:hypothetical protein
LAGLKEDIPFLLLLGATVLYIKLLREKSTLNLETYKKYFLCSLFISVAFIIIGLFVFPYLSRGAFGTAHSNIIFKLHSLDIGQFDGNWLKLFFFLSGLFAIEIWILIVPLLLLFSLKSIGPGDWHSFLPLIIICIGAIEGYKRSQFSANTKLFYLRQVAIVVTIGLLCIWSEQGIRLLGKAVKDAEFRPYLGNYESLRELDGDIPKHAYLRTTADLMVRYTNRAHLTWSVGKAEYVVINRNLMKRSLRRYGYDYDYTLIDYVRNSDKFILVKSVDSFELYRRNIRGHFFSENDVQAP